MKSANIRYLPGLDHLRAFAALLIVFYHGVVLLSLVPRGAGRDFRPLWILPRHPFVVLIEEGHTAVALFMVLSGFVFTTGCVGKEVEYWPFVKNRLLRIYPLFIVMLLVGIAAAPGGYSLLGLLETLLFQANLPGAINIEPFTSMFWAVGIEFQFYLAFPFLHRFMERHGSKWAVGFILLMLALRFLALRCGANNGRDIAYWHIVGRIDQFVIGMLAARAYVRVRHEPQRWGWWTLASFVLVLATLVTYSALGAWDSLAGWKIAWPTVEALVWACFITSYVGFAQAHAGKWSLPLEQIGSWSYSIYLFHFGMLQLMPKLIPFVPGHNPNRDALLYTLGVVLPVLLAMAALSFYLIERPFLELRVRYLRARDSRVGTADPAPVAAVPSTAGD
jgi:peptidoglycan/LPS O-acetylase OafA/YrhL